MYILGRRVQREHGLEPGDEVNVVVQGGASHIVPAGRAGLPGSQQDGSWDFVGAAIRSRVYNGCDLHQVFRD
jgi:hypothetical protein